MTDDIWTIIPKGTGHPSIGQALVLKIGKTKKGFLKLILSVPLFIRKKSDYFNTPTMYCNLLEKGPLIMIQFIPKAQATKDSRSLHNGTFWLPPRNFKNFLNGRQKRIEVPYRIDNGNIVIDRNTLKDAKEVG